VITSDHTRKRLAGMRDEDRSAAADPPETGLYSKARSEQVYAAMLERAGPVLNSGRNVIFDASFSRTAQRDTVRHWAANREVPTRLLQVTCNADTAIDRLASRELSGHGPSDAGPSLHRWSVENFEPPTEWPSESAVEIATDDPVWRAGLSNVWNQWRTS
jgi:predicted kinase